MDEEEISKTKRKQAMHELQALGVELVALSESLLSDMALEPGLLKAVLEAKRIRSHEGKRRQLQYIGRLMRDVDAAPIRARLADLKGESAQSAAAHRRTEALRARLMEDDEALTGFAAEHPGADLQALRALLRNARKEAKEGKPPRAYRELFRFLRDAESQRQDASSQSAAEG
ncbi:MAG TPA: ribosome biogenesis factor YjgA [Burkholderiales bacterium]|nr:ribosome biogenesis factor YjgA [Burkholderiales bacterium]